MRTPPCPPHCAAPARLRVPPAPAYRVALGGAAPVTRSGRTTLGRDGDIPSPDAAAAVVAHLDERGGRVFLTALGAGDGEDDVLLPEAASVWLDGERVRLGVAYSVAPAGGVVTLADGAAASSSSSIVVTYDVADDGGAGDMVARLAAGALAAGANAEVRARLEEGGVL